MDNLPIAVARRNHLFQVGLAPAVAFNAVETQ
jgi:hypothetical protein